VTEDVVSRVEDEQPDLLVTYHPLIFRPTRTLVGGRSPNGRALRLVQSGTALAVAHTAWDVAPGGAADALAAALGIADPVPFGVSAAADQIKVVTFVPEHHVAQLVAAMSEAGGGTIGRYEGCHFTVTGHGGFIAGQDASPVVGETGANLVAESRVEMVAPASRRESVVAALVGAHPYEEPAFDVYPVEANSAFIGRIGTLQTSLGSLVATVESQLGTSTRVAGVVNMAVARVAAVPGSGGSLIGVAAGAGADVIVTGDVSHHTMVEANDRGMAVVDAGHAATERPGIEALVERITEAFSGRIPVLDYRDLDPSPWQ
jgi:dinuclear metal center YbgI/SA1388 family protein